MITLFMKPASSKTFFLTMLAFSNTGKTDTQKEILC